MVDSNRSPGPGYFTGNYKQGFSGGLFTQASPLSVPETYSPAMENVFINRRLNLQTRYGTNSLVGDVPNCEGLYYLKSSLGAKLLLSKEGTSLNVYDCYEDGINDVSVRLLRSFTNVWSSEALDSRANFSFVNDDRDRIIICTGNNAPVQVRLTERKIVRSGNVSSLTIVEPEQFAGAGWLALYNNDTWVAPSEYTFDGTNVILNSGPRTGTFLVLHLGWQWWTEAKYYFGFNATRVQNRFNLAVSDLSVTTPPELLPGIRYIEGTSRLPIRLYKNGLKTQEQTYAAAPTAEEEYAFSGGSFADSSNKNKVLPGITHVTFGARNADDTDISELTFVKGLDISDFNGGAKLRASDLSVIVNDTASNFLTQTSNEYGNAYLGHTNSQWLNQTNSVSTAERLDFISFAATDNVGLGSADLVRIIRESRRIDNNGNQLIGASAGSPSSNLPYDNAAENSWWPIYGLSEHADYLYGSFPKYVCTHENRLVLAGFAFRPNRIVLSSVTDTVIPGDSFSDFSIREQEGVDTNAVVVDLNTTDSSNITGIVSAAGVLFVFTTTAVYALRGGEGGITPLQKYVTRIASVGAVNAQSIAQINDSVVFLSKSGLYQLAQSFDAAGGWRTNLLSAAINDRVKSSSNENHSWLMWLPNEELLFVAVCENSTTVADALYVWRRDIEAWTKFTEYTGYFETRAGTFVDLAQNYLVFARRNADNGNTIASYPYKFPLDVRDSLVVIKDSVGVENVVRDLSFRIIPDVGIDDLGVRIGDVDYFKINNRQVFTASFDDASDDYYPDAVGDNLVVIYRNGVLFTAFAHNVLDGSLTPAAEADDVVGFVYKCFVTTPNLFAASQNPSSYLNSYKTIHQGSFVFHTNGDYLNFGVNIKRVDVDPTQTTAYNTFPPVDTSQATQFDKALLDSAVELVRPLYKIVVHPGGIETPFHQFIVFSDSVYSWELISYQVEVSQSSTRMR